MKRRDLIQHLRNQGCVFVREGSEHSIWKIRKHIDARLFPDIEKSLNTQR